MARSKAAHCWVICKKTFSVSLIFNALVSIGCAAGILAGFYWRYQNWQPFAPYLVSATVFWVLIAAAVINIFPSARLGRSLHTGRLFFHHYFYGFLVLFFSAVYVIVFTPVSLFSIFFINNTSVAVNVGRVFLLGGSALVLDDLPDVHGRIDSSLNWLKVKAGQGGKFLSALQLVTGAISFYLFAAIALAMNRDPSYITVANLIVLVSVFITSFTSFIFVKRRVWLKIKC
ncbi:MAG: hypothetical protein M1490_00590 [Candidatus Bathyarchaeota archaeon]|nr:hypothetical protein [Candidatus Bathyarchaeota archaeon]